MVFRVAAKERPAHRLLDSLSTAVLLLDERLRLLYLNPAAEDLFAVSLRQALGIEWSVLVHAEAGMVSRLEAALASQHPYTERELELGSGKGRITVDCTVTPLSASEILIELVQVDRHLRISREEQLLVQQQAARELLRGLAHEIKNPLGGLRGAAQLLERELEQPDLKEYTQVIIGEADRLRNLVNRMLGPNNVPDKRAVNIHEILEHVRNLVDAEAHEHLAIHREYDPSIPELQADPELLVQAVLNIVRNAAQAGGTDITLRTRAQRQFTIGHARHKLVARVDISDNGPGIDPDIQEKIFYPMVTGRAQGTGLGLSIAQSLINEHGGLIECESEPGNTVFTILLPLESEHG